MALLFLIIILLYVASRNATAAAAIATTPSTPHPTAPSTQGSTPAATATHPSSAPMSPSTSPYQPYPYPVYPGYPSGYPAAFPGYPYPYYPVLPGTQPAAPLRPSAGIGATQLIETQPAVTLQSPSLSADVQTVTTYLLNRGTTLDGLPFSSDIETALKNPTSWQVRGGTPPSYIYPSGINTLESYKAYFDDASNMWNVRVNQ